jgi:hypothetical protein
MSKIGVNRADQQNLMKHGNNVSYVITNKTRNITTIKNFFKWLYRMFLSFSLSSYTSVMYVLELFLQNNSHATNTPQNPKFKSIQKIFEPLQ